VVLSKDGRLLYYSDKGKECKGCVDLSGAKSETATANKPFAFQVHYPANAEQRKFLFSVSSAEEVKDWVAKINGVISTLGDNKAHQKQKTIKEVQSVVPADEDPIVTDLLAYWFQDVKNGDDTELGQQQIAFWFMRNAMVDNLICNNYEEVWKKAVKGECDHWTKTSRGLIALIILLDQFTRNMYRDTPKMLQGDPKCSELVKKAIHDGVDKTLPNYQKVWVYTALARAEDPKILEQCVALMEGLHNSSKTSKGFYENGIKFTKGQHELLKRFGRYPNRNALLGRTNTEEENKYLNSDNKFFST